MKSRKQPGARASTGFTIAEVLVSLVILGVLSGSLYWILSSARQTTSLSTARGQAKDMVEIILRSMERDISTSFAVVTALGENRFAVERSFQALASGGCTMLVPEALPGPKKEVAYKRVEYLFDPSRRTIERNDASGSRRLLCSEVDMLEIKAVSTFTSLVELEVKVSIIPSGSQVPQSHHQKLVVSIRQARESNLDPRWRTPGEFSEEKY